MPKIFLSEVPCSEEFLSSLQKSYPEVDSYSFFTYLTVRKVTSDLENSLESYFSTYGVSAGRFMLLLLLAAQADGMMPSELAQQCNVTQATISGLLNGLEKSQLIMREAHSHDGRSFLIKLSSKGHELLNRIKPEFLKCVGSVMDEFSMPEKQSFVESLLKLRRNLKFLVPEHQVPVELAR
jgi:MarR family transcriptional repressor of emrRAB